MSDQKTNRFKDNGPLRILNAYHLRLRARQGAMGEYTPMLNLSLMGSKCSFSYRTTFYDGASPNNADSAFKAGFFRMQLIPFLEAVIEKVKQGDTATWTMSLTNDIDQGDKSVIAVTCEDGNTIRVRIGTTTNINSGVTFPVAIPTCSMTLDDENLDSNAGYGLKWLEQTLKTVVDGGIALDAANLVLFTANDQKTTEV